MPGFLPYFRRCSPEKSGILRFHEASLNLTTPFGRWVYGRPVHQTEYSCLANLRLRCLYAVPTSQNGRYHHRLFAVHRPPGGTPSGDYYEHCTKPPQGMGEDMVPSCNIGPIPGHESFTDYYGTHGQTFGALRYSKVNTLCAANWIIR